uniref:Uncharacterized protein n=1 Tax=Anopheles farauti TaxID=69004 RepID=A0A182QFP3_9DIPT
MISLPPSTAPSGMAAISTSATAHHAAPIFNVVDVTGLGSPALLQHADKPRTNGGAAAAAAIAMPAHGTQAPDQWPLRHAKGLLNGPGQNNCFLNCAVQIFAAPRKTRARAQNVPLGGTSLPRARPVQPVSVPVARAIWLYRSDRTASIRRLDPPVGPGAKLAAPGLLRIMNGNGCEDWTCRRMGKLSSSGSSPINRFIITRNDSLSCPVYGHPAGNVEHQSGEGRAKQASHIRGRAC